MLARVISGVIAAAVLIVVLCCDVWVIGICAAVLSVWCLLEAFGVFSYHKNPAFLFVGLVACAASPFLSRWDFSQMTGLLFLSLIVLAGVMVAVPQKVNVTDVARVMFLSLMIPVSLNLLVQIRSVFEFGIFYIWLPFIGAFMSDIGAFFVGRSVGGPKLCEALSPKKTISGSIGGLIGSVVGFFLYSLVLKFGFQISVSPIWFYGLALLCSVTGQLGDLTMSALKRQANVKDFGNVMPGHGGMLDRLDSVIFAGPMVYIFIVTFGLQIMRY
ncbi:MAG: phosphatidate cytidylyltransferase [Clostridia bacterium]|nr:phosphatidate cytidylyltransferase [Clostridia bacterium]